MTSEIRCRHPLSLFIDQIDRTNQLCHRSTGDTNELASSILATSMSRLLSAATTHQWNIKTIKSTTANPNSCCLHLASLFYSPCIAYHQQTTSLCGYLNKLWPNKVWISWRILWIRLRFVYLVKIFLNVIIFLLDRF